MMVNTFAVKLVELGVFPTASFNGVLADGLQYGVTWLSGNEGFKDEGVDSPLTSGNPSRVCIIREESEPTGKVVQMVGRP